MGQKKKLCLYEELMLLALRDEKGTVSGAYIEQAIAGAILAQLLLERRISIADTRRVLVDVDDSSPTGDAILDMCLQTMAQSSRRASLRNWVSRLARAKQLRHQVARKLCERGILRADEGKVLFVFTRKIYPEINPQPEREILDRLYQAIYAEKEVVSPRTSVIISLAKSTGLLAQAFGAGEIRRRRKRIKQIEEGQLAGKATREVIAACQAAVMVAAVMPAVMVTSHH